MPDTLFGHLAGRFAAQPEDMATESLCYILRSSEVARDAFRSELQKFDVALPGTLSFRTQVSLEDDSTPDLVATNSEGKNALMIESKFWAGLTKKQPVSYMQALPKGSSLVFLVPQERFTPLWRKLEQRCEEEWTVVEANAAADASSSRQAHVEGCDLILLNWRGLLAGMLTDLESQNEKGLASDVRQLQGLCDRMEDEAFLPMQSEELTTTAFPKRVRQLYDLLGEMAREDFPEWTHGRASGGAYYYGYPLRYADLKASLRVDFACWVLKELTPLWIIVEAKTRARQGAVRDAYEAQQKGEATSIKAYIDNESREVKIPVHVRTGADKSDVKRAIERELERAAQAVEESS